MKNSFPVSCTQSVVYPSHVPHAHVYIFLLHFPFVMFDVHVPIAKPSHVTILLCHQVAKSTVARLSLPQTIVRCESTMSR